MRKKVFGYQLNRDKNERKALFRSLVSNLLEKGEIETTLAKAKAIQAETEKLITRGKKGAMADRRIAQRFLIRRGLVDKLFNQIAPVFKDKIGGYTRIVRTGFRQGDNALLVKIALTEELPVIAEEISTKEKTANEKPAAKKTKTVSAKVKGKPANKAEEKNDKSN